MEKNLEGVAHGGRGEPDLEGATRVLGEQMSPQMMTLMKKDKNGMRKNYREIHRDEET